MSSFSSDQIRSYLQRGTLNRHVLGEGMFRVAITRIGPGMVWVKVNLETTDNFSFVPVVTEDLRMTLNLSSHERFFLVESSLENNLAFIDMITAIFNSLNKGARLDALLNLKIVLSEYLEFFAQRRNLILSRQRQLGLLGELIVLEEIFSHVNDSSSAIATWHGPMGKPQDFSFRSSFALEVKCRMGLDNSVVISNEQQLDASQICGIFLCVFTAIENPNGVSLQAMLNKCLANCDSIAADALYLKIRMLGIEKWTFPYYDNYRLKFEAPEIYRVDGESNVITPQIIPISTSNVRYKLQLSALNPVKTSLKSLISEIAKDE